MTRRLFMMNLVAVPAVVHPPTRFSLVMQICGWKLWCIGAQFQRLSLKNRYDALEIARAHGVIVSDDLL
jgi:hypothetical protein